MSGINEVVIVSAVRTAIGSFGGSLKEIPTTELAAKCVRAAVTRAQIDPNDVGSCVFGSVIHGEPKDMYLARVAGVQGGLPVSTPAMTVNRLCGSGLQAVISAAQQIMLGEISVAVAGGAENMSRASYAVPSARWGQKMGEAKLTDMMLAALHDPFGHGHMGITAENIAAKWNISRDAQDAFAFASQHRGVRAREAGYFKEQILPIEIVHSKGSTIFDSDEYIRGDVSLEGLRALKPAFKKDGTVTAGNASGLNDGAAALVIMSAAEAQERGLSPMARIAGYSHAAVEPSEMGIGPVPAVRKLMKKIGLTIADMDTIESNEAFAAQAIAVARDLDLPADKTNPNGGAIAMGHPIGATGAILTVKALYELKRTGKEYGLITMCIGGGQGIAMVIENFASK